MTILVKRSGTYAEAISISVKRAGVYTTPVGIFVKRAGVYVSAQGAPTYDSDTIALLSRMSTAPNSVRASSINSLIIGLKNAGIWGKLDRLYVAASHDAQAAKLDWRGGGSTDYIVSGALTFVTDRGFQGDGVSGYLSGQGAPAAMTQYQQDSATWGMYVLKAGSLFTQTAHLGRAGAVDNLTINCGPGSINMRINASSGDTVPVYSSVGFTAGSRTDANTMVIYRDGAAQAVKTRASTARSTNARTSLRNNATYSSDLVAVELYGSALTDTEHTTMSNLFTTYLQNCGWSRILTSPAASTHTLVSATTLPDTSGTPTGLGFCSTGLAKASAGGFWVGNHYGPISIVRVSDDATTILAELVLGAGNLASIGGVNRSVQGVVEAPDGTIYAAIKSTGGGATSVILRCQQDGVVISQWTRADINGLGYDADRGCVIVSVSRSILWLDSAGSALATYQMPLPIGELIDQIHYLGGDRLLFTSDPGRVFVVDMSEWGVPVVTKIITLAGADAIEGVVVDSGILYVVNDAGFHTGSPPLNRMLRYDAAGI